MDNYNAIPELSLVARHYWMPRSFDRQVSHMVKQLQTLGFTSVAHDHEFLHSQNNAGDCYTWSIMTGKLIAIQKKKTNA